MASSKHENFYDLFYYSQVKGHRSPRTPRVSKQDYLNFTSDPSLWLCIDNHFRCELQHYLHSPMPKPQEFDYIESSSMSSASSIEDDLEHEEETNSIDDSFQGSVASHHGEPSLQDEEDSNTPFDEVDIDRAFERSIVSSDDVGRSFAVEPNSNRHHHQAYDHSSNLLTSNDKIHTCAPESEVPSSSARIREAQLQDLQDLNQSHFESHSSTFECEELPNFKLDLEAFENLNFRIFKT